MTLNRHNLWVSSRDYVVIVLGIFIYAFGFSAFIFPEKVVIGGVAGLGTLVYFVTQRIFGWGIPVAVTQYVVNLLLLAMAYRAVGRTFVLRTIFGTTVISLFIGLLVPLFPEPLIHGETFMNIIIGGICCGVGVGMVFTHNGSTGGTDIVAALVAKKTNTTVGRTMLYVDMCIISSSYFLFHEIETVIFGYIILFCTAYITDLLINTNRQAVQFTIISEHWEKIATAINNDAHRGCTVLTGMGWYSRHEVKMLIVMCRKIEAVTIFRIVKSVDENAFITQANVNGVYGQGFDAVKLKVKRQPASDNHTETSREGGSCDGASIPSPKAPME